jgi:hypothetical protein
MVPVDMDVDGTGNKHQKDIAYPFPQVSPNHVSSCSMADLSYIFTYS